MAMRGECEPEEIATKLAHVADDRGLTEFEVHGMVRDAFRGVHKRHLERLRMKWDLAFEELARSRDSETGEIHVHEIGGENMSKPVKEFSAGSVRAAIWENERGSNGNAFISHTIRVERRYRDNEGEWQSTNGFHKGDLPNVELVVRKAFEFLSMQERDPQEEKDSNSEERK